MGHVLKQKYRNKDGSYGETDRYNCRFKDHRGRDRQISAFRDHRASTEFLRKLESLVSYRSSDMPLPTELVRWVAGLPEKIAGKLADWEIIEPQTKGRTIAKHVQDYKDTLLAQDVTKTHAARQFNRLTKMLTGMKVTRYPELTKNGATLWLAKFCKDNDLGNVTFNHHLNVLQAWCSWMISDHRAAENPVADIPEREAGVGKRYKRRALTPAELSALILTTQAKADRILGIPAAERALIYRMALETGLRSNEIRSLKIEDFQFGDRQSVTIRASGAKNRKEATLPLRADLAGALQSFFGLRPGGEPALRMPYKNYVARMLRSDLESIGIVKAKKGELHVDFHSLRHTYITNLANAGVLPHVCQKLARHSSIELTMRYYTHLRVDQDRQAVDLLPVIQLAPEEKKEGIA